MHGSLHDNCKITLRKLQEAFKAGVIDNDFINKGAWAEAPDDIVKHKIGMVSGPIWFGDWRCKDVMVAMGNNKATWTKMPFPDARTSYTAKPDDIWIINAKCKYPEAAVAIGNLTGELMTGSISEGRYHDQRDPSGNIIDNFFHALGTSFNKITAWNLHCARLVTESLETGDTSKLNDEMMSYYERCKSYVDWKPGNPTEELLGYTSYSIFGPGGSQYTGEKMDKEGLQIANAYYGPNTNTMNENLGNLNTKRNEIFTAIILGQNVDEGFKEWTSFWGAMNGDTITKEVNDWYAAQK
jgi:putative aldouronate transport system substrate-binding protein